MKRVKTDDPNSVDIFINALKNNQIIAYPTDTIYGLGTDINNNEGIDRINLIKMRKQPMSVALGNFEIIKNNINGTTFKNNDKDSFIINFENYLKNSKNKKLLLENLKLSRNFSIYSHYKTLKKFIM